MKELITLQSKLKAPKNQRNSFGGYNYRSAEDILEAVKPLLAEVGCTLTISDDIIEVGGRVYVKATTTLTNSAGEVVSTTAMAREEENRKGMDSSQITGATSSYARKYALNGLFCIDDTKDADATNKHGKEETKIAPTVPSIDAMVLDIKSSTTKKEITEKWNLYKAYDTDKQITEAVREVRQRLGV